MSRWLCLIAIGSLMSCAEAGSSDDDGNTDAGNNPTADGGSADARPGTADARPLDTGDGGNVCPTSPCDLVAQCGCAAGDACDLDIDMLPNTECRAAGAGTETSTCAAFIDCAAQHVCVSAGAGDDASCKRYCNVDADCGAPNGKCIIGLVNGTMDIEGATVCSSNCDPTNSAAGGCPATWGCYPGIIDPDGTADSGDEAIIVDCSPAGAGTQGATCTTDSDCAANYACINTGGGTECLRICDTGAPDCADAPGTTCQNTDPPLTLGAKTYGICI